MVGIGSEVKGHVEREQMETAAHGGRWTTIWEMKRWDGGGRKEGEMIRRPEWKKEGVALGLHSSLPKRTPSLGCGPLPSTHGDSHDLLSKEDELRGPDTHLHPYLCCSVIGFAFTSMFSPFSAVIYAAGSLSVSFSSICLLVRSVEKDHFSSPWILLLYIKIY